MGEFLVREGFWRTNPLRWIRGPKLDPRRHLPRRIGKEQFKSIWDAAQGRPQEHARYQALCALGILYGTGLRRGELERLSVQDWDRDNSLLKIDGRKTGHPRHVPVGAGVWRCIEAYLPRRRRRVPAAKCPVSGIMHTSRRFDRGFIIPTHISGFFAVTNDRGLQIDTVV